MNKAIAVIAGIVGVVLIILGIYYWVTPASNLPSFFPGYSPTLHHVIHYKHGIAAFILGILAFIVAWFASKKK